MKTAVSLPDDVFQQAERLAKRLKVSRSELYSKAIQDYLRNHAPDVVTEAYNQLADEIDEEPRRFIRTAARKVFEKAEW